MKVFLYVSFFVALGFILLTCFRFLGESTLQGKDCFTKENFEKTFHYIQWKHKTSKKLSANQKVILEDGYEVEALEDEINGRYILFSKKAYKFFSLNSSGQYIPHTKKANLKQYQSYFCKLFARASFANLPLNYMYKYIDGSNNVWLIASDNIEYKPIAKENSSSGEYSGGEPFKKNIELTQFQAIQSLLKKGLSNKAIHLEDRNMGCGTVLESVTENVSAQQCYLPMNSAEKKAIEDWLRKLKE